MAGVHEHRPRQAWLLEWLDSLTLEADPLVTPQHRLVLAPIAPGDPAVALADRGRDGGDLKPTSLARVSRASERIEGFQEESAHEIRLKPTGFRLLHLLFDGEQAVGAHRLLGKRVTVQECLKVLPVERLVDLLRQPRADLRSVPIADRFHQQILEAGLLEELTQ